MKQLVSPTNISISNMNASYKYFCALWEFTVGRLGWRRIGRATFSDI